MSSSRYSTQQTESNIYTTELDDNKKLKKFKLNVLFKLTHRWPSSGTLDCPEWAALPGPSYWGSFWIREGIELFPRCPQCTAADSTRHIWASAQPRHRSAQIQTHSCSVNTTVCEYGHQAEHVCWSDWRSHLVFSSDGERVLLEQVCHLFNIQLKKLIHLIDVCEVLVNEIIRSDL